jgi:hypothetical protein
MRSLAAVRRLPRALGDWQNLHARDLNPQPRGWEGAGRDRANLQRQPHDDLLAQGTARSPSAVETTLAELELRKFG